MRQWSDSHLSQRVNTAFVPTLLAGMLCALIGSWFALKQINLLDDGALYPPMRLMCGTTIRVGLTAFIAFIYCRAYLKWRGAAGAAWLSILPLLPLLLVFLKVSFPHALDISLLSITALCIYHGLPGQTRAGGFAGYRHWLTLALILLAQILFNGYFSPLTLPRTPFHLPGTAAPQLAVIWPLYQDFIWIKQFSLAALDYGYWLIAPDIPLNFQSPLLQLTSLAADSPSMDITAFYRQLHLLFFLFCTAESFGFYLFLNKAMRFKWSVSTLCGMIFLFAQEPFFTITLYWDYMIAISTQVVFPFALCAMFCALRQGSAFLAALSGAILGSAFLLINPHPEILLIMLLCFSVLTLACACAEQGVARVEKLKLMAIGAIWFLLVSAFQIGPMLLSRMDGGLIIQGHAEAIPGGLAGLGLDFSLLAFLHLLAASAAACYLFRRLRGRRLILPLTALALLVLLAPLHSLLLRMAAGLLHLQFNLAIVFYGRRGYYIAFCALLLVAYALNELNLENSLKRLSTRIGLRQRNMIAARTALVMLAILCCACLALKPRQEAAQAGCTYYLLLDALLANYPLLKGDDANIALIRERLHNFERDSVKPSAQSYRQAYGMLLQDLHIASVAELSDPAQLHRFAKQAAPLIDRFYTDADRNCVNPADACFTADGKFYLLPNLAALYAGLPTSFLRIAGFTADTSLPGIAPKEVSGSLSFGTGPGLFVHNGSTDYDARFMVGPTLLHALYLLPGYDFAPLGISYFVNRNWLLTPDMLLNATDRKALDIAGIDEVLIPQSKLEVLSRLDFEPVKVVNPPAFSNFSELALLHNRRSYGMAYLAEHIRSMAPGHIAALEKTIRVYLLQHIGFEAYKAAREELYTALIGLQHRHDILLETELPKQETGPSGNAIIRNILGEATVMRADCKRSQCVLVYNLAFLPGWHAYSDGKPLEIMRANFAFMSVAISRGMHEVWFVYSPDSNLCFTLLSLLMIALLPALHARRRLKLATEAANS